MEVLQVVHPLAQAEQVAVPPVEVWPAGQAVQEVPFVSWKLAVHDWHVTVPLILVLHVAHPDGQAEQEVTAPPAEVVPAAQAEQAPLLRKKLSVQVLQVTLVPAVVQVAQPFPQAEH